MISAKKWRNIIEGERLEISSRKLGTKGTFHAKMGLIKDINGMDLTEAEGIKKKVVRMNRRTIHKRSS